MCYELKKPASENEQMTFKAEYIYKQGLRFEDTDMFLFALERNEIMGEKEIDIEVPEYETVEQEIEVPVYDEDGNPVYDEDGNPVTRKEKQEVVVPVMIEYEEEETVIDYDDEGNPIGSHTIIVKKQKQKTHIEKITVPYPVIDPDFEEKEQARIRKELDALTLTPSDVERALYYSELEMDFDDLKELIKTKAPQIDLKGLAIEFRANNFFRGAVDKDGNRIIDMVGLLLGYNSDDMDYLFQHKELPKKNNK